MQQAANDESFVGKPPGSMRNPSSTVLGFTFQDFMAITSEFIPRNLCVSAHQMARGSRLESTIGPQANIMSDQ
jgi:hypothetical protein